VRAAWMDTPHRCTAVEPAKATGPGRAV